MNIKSVLSGIKSKIVALCGGIVRATFALMARVLSHNGYTVTKN